MEQEHVWRKRQPEHEADVYNPADSLWAAEPAGWDRWRREWMLW